MIRVVIKGGIGNQMFQYAYAKTLAKTWSQSLALDLSFYDKDNIYRSYALDKLGVNEVLITKKPRKLMLSFWKKLAPFNLFLLKHKLPPLTTIYLDGYWQSEKYFNGEYELIRSLFKFPEPPNSIKQTILDSESIAVHVRRGDYVNIPRRHICHLEYFIQAMQRIQNRIASARFFIFSDDIEWCNKILESFPNATLVNHCESDIQELYLMSLCKHTIISNSSFSWWGAWLNEKPEKIVVSPDRWVDDEKLNDEFMVKDQIIPDRWIKLALTPQTQ